MSCKPFQIARDLFVKFGLRLEPVAWTDPYPRYVCCWRKRRQHEDVADLYKDFVFFFGLELDFALVGHRDDQKKEYLV